MPLFTGCNINLRCPQNVSVMFQLKIPPIDHLLYHFENAHLSGSRNTAFWCMSL